MLVTEQKVIIWLRYDILRKNRNMGEENLMQHVKAASDLWRTQQSMGINKAENPRHGKSLRGLLKKHRREKLERQKNLYSDKGAGSLIDGYQMNDIPRIAGYFLSLGTAVGFRSRLDFLLAHAALGRSEDNRNATLSDMYTYLLEDEGASECQALIITLRKGKTNQEGSRQLAVAIRHRYAERCPVGALALYFFFRFHIQREPFPDFSSPRAWFDLCLLRGKSPVAPITYQQQHNAVKSCYAALGIQSTKVMHAMRGAGKIGTR